MHRVLIVHPYCHVGGPDTFVTNIVRCLRPRGFRFWVLLAQERALARTLRESGAVTLIHPSLQTLPRTLSPIRLAHHLLMARSVASSVRGLIEQQGVSVIHAVHETMWPVLMSLRGKRVGRVVSVHGLRFASPPWAGRLNTRLLTASTDRVVCVSEVVRRVLRQWEIPEEKLALVPSSVDLTRFHTGISGAAFRRELGIALERPLVGTVGSVDRRKGHGYFVEACVWLNNRFPNAHFVIVGHTGNDGPAAQVEYVRQLRAQVTALGLDNCFSFMPARLDIPEVMAALDLLVQPSLTEAGPRAPLEAMAMGRPVVGTRIEGTAEEVVDGVTGILVEPRDSMALARAIAALLDDPAQRGNMGREGRARVERFYSLTRTAELVEHLYQEAAARQAS